MSRRKASNRAPRGAAAGRERVLRRAVAVIRARCDTIPRLAVVLGSGFAGAAEALLDPVAIPCGRIPGFKPTTVPGHRGRLLVGALGGVPVLVAAGRIHYYEGHDLETVTFPIRVFAALGVRAVLLTNAAGGISPRLRPGDFMVVSDHLNLMGANPLRGSPATDARFVDLTRVYSPRLRRLLLRAARDAGLRAREGVYAAVAGPSYETPAEIRAFRTLGADAVGMSTVPEAVVARACGLEVAAVSCITNAAAGRSDRPISHAEVLAAGERVRAPATELLGACVRLWARLGGG